MLFDLGQLWKKITFIEVFRSQVSCGRKAYLENVSCVSKSLEPVVRMVSFSFQYQIHFMLLFIKISWTVKLIWVSCMTKERRYLGPGR